MRKLDWRFISLMVGMIVGYAAALTVEQWGWVSYPGLLFRVVCAISGSLLGLVAFWTSNRINPG